MLKPAQFVLLSLIISLPLQALARNEEMVDDIRDFGNQSEIPIPNLTGIFPPGLNQKQPQGCHYYDVNLNLKSTACPTSGAPITSLNIIPTPLAIYESGQLILENTGFINQLSEDDKAQFANALMHPQLNGYIKAQHQGGNRYQFSYDLGPIQLSFPNNQRDHSRFTLKTAINALSASTHPQYYPRYKELIESMQKDVASPAFNNNLRRETEDSGLAPIERQNYSMERMRYSMQSYKKRAEAISLASSMTKTRPPRVNQCSANNRSSYQFSIIPFKPGDLDQSCRNQVDNGIRSGFGKVTLFYPIPYSGGDSKHQSMYGPGTTKKLKEGYDYQYELAGFLPKEELHRCLDYIAQAGLEINFVPHLESIVTLNARGEAEWRIHSAIPLDNRYYEMAYGDLRDWVRNNQTLMRGKPLRLSAAAEVDPMFLGNTDDSLTMMSRLRTEFTSLGVNPEITWNPNGDFHNGWDDIATRNLDCQKLTQLLSSVDRIAPSLYEDYQHIINGSFLDSKNHFFRGLHTHLQKLCPSQARQLNSIVSSKPFSIGEFSLTDSNYQHFHQQMQHYRQQTGDVNSDATFWNAGQWDHAGTTGPSPIPEKQQQIRQTFAACNQAPANRQLAQASDLDRCQNQAPSILASQHEITLEETADGLVSH